MRLLIVGLNHQIQRAEILSGGDVIVDLETNQKQQFADLIAKLIQSRHATFLGEEAQEGVEPIAHKVAQRLECTHANIEMSHEERERRGIPADYTREDRPYTSEQRASWNSEREQFMFEAVVSNSAAGSAIVLCGRQHVDELALLFERNGHSVETYDINREPWYIEDWLQHAMSS